MQADDPVLANVQTYLTEVSGLIPRLSPEVLAAIVVRLETARWEGRMIFTCGNGGSAATAIHLAGDLAKGALNKRKPPVRVMSLCENIALLTAWANDASYVDVFAERLRPFVRPGDVLIAISGSGNSANVLKAVELAKLEGATTIGFTGFDGGKLRPLVDIALTVPSTCMEQIEDAHMVLCHLVAFVMRNAPVRLAGLAAGVEVESQLSVAD